MPFAGRTWAGVVSVCAGKGHRGHGQGAGGMSRRTAPQHWKPYHPCVFAVSVQHHRCLCTYSLSAQDTGRIKYFSPALALGRFLLRTAPFSPRQSRSVCAHGSNYKNSNPGGTVGPAPMATRLRNNLPAFLLPACQRSAQFTRPT